MDALTAAMNRERERRRRQREQQAQEKVEKARLDHEKAEAQMAAIEEAMASASKICSYSDGELTMAGRDLQEVPECVIKAYALETTVIDLAYNQITALAFTKNFFWLEELVLDNNTLRSPLGIQELPFLRVLSLNNNQIDDIHGLVAELKGCPRLSFLSLLRNPVCPDCLSDATEGEYRLYRAYIISSCPTLQFLDSVPVTKKEKQASDDRFELAHIPPIVPLKVMISDFESWIRGLPLVCKLKAMLASMRKRSLHAKTEEPGDSAPVMQNQAKTDASYTS